MIKEIKFTDNALKQIESLLAKKDIGSFFRIAIKGGGCSGFQYEFTFDKSKICCVNSSIKLDKLKISSSDNSFVFSVFG